MLVGLIFPGVATYAVVAKSCELLFTACVTARVPLGSVAQQVRLPALPGIGPVIAEPEMVLEAVKAEVPLANTYPLSVPAPVPPWGTLRGVVKPAREVMSEFAPAWAGV